MHIFDRDIALNEIAPLRFAGEVSGNWLINGIPNGGYLMALAAAAMMRAGGRRATPIVTANYISRCTPGPFEARVEPFAQSGQFSRLQASLFQEGSERLRVMGTFSRDKAECITERYETPPPSVAAREECVAVPALPNYTLFTGLDMRLDPASAGWMRGVTAEASEQKGWISLREERPHDVCSLLLMADSFPPPIFVSQGMVGWVPTIELSVNIRNMPQSRWLAFSLRTRFITCGMVEEDGEIWDEAGKLVAISRQIAQFRKNG